MQLIFSLEGLNSSKSGCWINSSANQLMWILYIYLFYPKILAHPWLNLSKIKVQYSQICHAWCRVLLVQTISNPVHRTKEIKRNQLANKNEKTAEGSRSSGSTSSHKYVVGFFFLLLFNHYYMWPVALYRGLGVTCNFLLTLIYICAFILGQISINFFFFGTERSISYILF